MPTEDKKRLAHKAVVTRVLEGDSRASRAERRAAFDNTGLAEPLSMLIEKVAKPQSQSGGRHQLEFPTVDVNGATAKVIDTPLGSLVTFQRGGVSYTVLGSVHASVAEAAARGL